MPKTPPKPNVATLAPKTAKVPRTEAADTTRTHTDTFGIEYLEGDLVQITVHLEMGVSIQYQGAKVSAGISFKSRPEKVDEYIQAAINKIRAGVAPRVTEAEADIIKILEARQG